MLHIIKNLDLDWHLNLAVFFLLAFGLVAIYSLSINDSSSGINNFYKQLIFLAISLFFYLFFAFFDYRNWKKYSSIFYFLGLILLILVLWVGKNIRGTSGWFDLGFFSLQPAELFKVFAIIILAKYFSKNATSILKLKDALLSFVYIAIPVFLIIKQPDFGSALVVLAIWFGMLFVSNINRGVFLGLLVFFIFLSLASWQFVLEDYQKNRIEAFINPQSDPLGSGYNVIQSTVAIGSGGMKGKGLGHGSQSQLNFLPEKHNDFIFAAIAEESGFIGALFIISVFSFLFIRFLYIAKASRDLFGHLLITGVITMFFFQILINIGMNLGMMPVAGLSLPFVSYGGSFLLVSMICLGLVQNIWKKRKKEIVSFDYD